MWQWDIVVLSASSCIHVCIIMGRVCLGAWFVCAAVFEGSLLCFIVIALNCFFYLWCVCAHVVYLPSLFFPHLHSFINHTHHMFVCLFVFRSSTAHDFEGCCTLSCVSVCGCCGVWCVMCIEVNLWFLIPYMPCLMSVCCKWRVQCIYVLLSPLSLSVCGVVSMLTVSCAH